jgi:O-antigen/teichoic acid export membrane protein
MLGIPVGLAYMLLIGLLIPLSAIGTFNRIELTVRLLTLVLTGGVFLLVNVPTPTHFLLMGLAAQVIMIAATWRSLALPVAVLHKPSLPQLWEHLPFAFRAYLAAFLAFLLVRLDMLMVQYISGNAEAGYYSIAVAMADLLYMFPAAVGALVFPGLSAMIDHASRLALTRKALQATAVAMTTMAIAAAFLAEPLIRLLFGERFLPAAPMFHVLALAIVVYGLNNIVSNYMMAIGLPWKGVWVWLVGVVANIVFNLYLIPPLGGRGAALASLAAYSLVLTIQGFMMLGTARGAAR